MSIDMYLSTSNDQVLSVSKLCKSQVEGYNEATKAINDFVLNSPTLKGKAYDSGKSYFNALLVPLVKGGILLSEAVEKAVKKFPEDYVEKVDSTSLKESELEERLQEVSNLLSRAENTRAELNSSKTPDLSKSFQLASNTMIIGMYETAKQKIEDQLRKLREFDAQSPQLFSEIASINHSINAGLSQVGKAWDASTGTFDQTRITDRTWATALNDEWDSRAERLEKELADEFAKEMQGRRYFRVQLATGAYEWMWVKDPSKVTQEDFQFNGKYKSYLDTLLNPKNSELDDYYITMAEELRSGINSKTGEPLTNLEKAQRWSAVASAISLIAIGAYYGKKGFTAEVNTTVKKASGADGTGNANKGYVTGADWENHFNNKYGAENVIRKGTATDFADIMKNGNPMAVHSIVSDKGSLPGKGLPNSSADLLNPDGSVKQRRYYDADGYAKQDIDFNHSDDGSHSFPHIHEWDWSKTPPRQSGK